MQNKLQLVKYRIKNAAIKSGRIEEDITLVAVTKSFPIGIWDFALQQNLTIIGESQIQEAEIKNKKFTSRNKIKLHLIGHLQRNKVKKAITLFDVIQTVDSIKLANKINTIANQETQIQKIFLQVNTGCDPNKNGFSPKEATTAAQKITNLKSLSLIGIMTIPPNNSSEKNLQTIYQETRKIRDVVQQSIEKHCSKLSMGMSDDYEIAIAEGATHIRLGTALFGKRPQ